MAAAAIDSADTKSLVKDLIRHCQQYQGADTRRGLIQLAVTFGLFLVMSGVMIWGMAAEFYWPLVLILPTGGLLVRLFIIQHDCGHRSFFHSDRANDMVGRFLSLFTLTPYDFWRQAHNMHHAGSGNLDRRGIGSIDTLTVEEFKKLSPRQQLLYRFYRHPFILLVLGTPFHVLVLQRFPCQQGSPFFENYKAMSFSRAWKSVFGLDLALVAFYGLLVFFLGLDVLMLVFLAPAVIAAWVGGWLFFIQHQFEDAYWQHTNGWSFQEAAVLGSSYYVLPKFLNWFTGNIGIHHVHHLCSAVPNYRLQECVRDSATLQSLNCLTISESLKCLRWRLWDSSAQRMIGFRELRTA